MKRYLVAGAVGTMVFGAALGSAAALNITDPGVAQFGQGTDVTCDDSVFVKGYGPDTDPDGPTRSYDITVGGIDGACYGKTLVAEVVDANGKQLAKGHAVMDAGEEKIGWTTKLDGQFPLVSDIQNVYLTIG